MESNTKLKTALEKACKAYIKAFEKQTETDVVEISRFDVYEVADLFIDLNTIIFVVENKIPFEALYNWYYLKPMFGAIKPCFEYYCFGAPVYTDEQRAKGEAKIKELENTLKELINESKKGVE